MLLTPAGLYQHILRPLPPVPSKTVLYKGALTTTTDENTTTWSNVDIGVPHPKRIVVLAAFLGVSANPTCTVANRSFYFGVRQNEFTVLAFLAPCCALADIVLTAASSIRKAVGVYVFYPDNHIQLDSGAVSAATTTDANLADLQVQKNGVLIYCGGQLATLGTFTTTWNGTDAVVEDADAQLESASSYTFGHINITVDTALSDLNMAESTSGTKRLAAVTLRAPRP
jgi:hypothetical protein